ncbi:DUF4328 domain-containing protein [Myroides sp. LJL119]
MAKKLDKQLNGKSTILMIVMSLISLVFLLQLCAALNYAWMNHLVIKGIFNALSYSTKDLSTLKQVGSVLTELNVYVYLSFAICFLCWFYVNFKQVKKQDKAIVEPAFWSVLMWFVPLLNLMVPLALVKRMFEGCYRFLTSGDVEYKKYSFWKLDIWWMCLLSYLSVEILQYFTMDAITILGLSWLLIIKYSFAFILGCFWFDWIRHYIGLSKKIQILLKQNSKENQDIKPEN